MADPDEALIEAIAEAVRSGSSYQADDPGEREVYVEGYDLKIARAVIERLGLVEERAREIGPSVNRPMRRLVSRWVEVDHGSE